MVAAEFVQIQPAPFVSCVSSISATHKFGPVTVLKRVLGRFQARVTQQSSDLLVKD
jgi:hypothetical protein